MKKNEAINMTSMKLPFIYVWNYSIGRGHSGC